MTLLTERYANKIRGQLSCYDRIVIQGTLPGLCYAQGMTTFLNINKIRIFDYPRFAEPFRNQLRENAEKIAQDNSLQIEFIKKKNFRKEERIQQILKNRGDHSGLVHIFSAMEPCPTYKPWHDKKDIAPIWNRVPANVCIIIFTFSMISWGFAMCVSLLGVRFVCKYISMVTTG